ncbi:unnamed protein product [Tenebrio molitor]|nr:unnamed protein product [Tenebrio molitor]
MTNIKSHLLTNYCIFIVNKMVMKKQRYMYIFLFFFR